MSEKTLIRNCSPTMAGLKTGNLFACDFESDAQMRECLRSYNRRLTPKGLRLLPVRYRNGRALIYVYRPASLARDLQDLTARDILHERGYVCDNPTSCVARLVKRLGEEGEFPHEIGLFLGYPPEDVHGFIELGAGACKCAGVWRVYGDEARAMRLFARYRKCTSVYSRQWEAGRSIERLTVSG